MRVPMSFFCSRTFYFTGLCPLHGWEVFELVDEDVPAPPTLCESNGVTPLTADSVTYVGASGEEMCPMLNALDARLDVIEAKKRLFAISTGALFTTILTSFADAGHAVWPGSTIGGTPQTFTAVVGVTTSLGDITVRVYDKTNSVVIAGPATTANDALKLLALTYNANASATPAVWALQAHTNNVLFAVSLGGLTAVASF